MSEIKVLLVDDDPNFRQSLCLLLERLDYACLKASSISEGKDLFQQHEDIQIVLLDIHLLEAIGIQSMHQFLHSYSKPQIIVLAKNEDPETAGQTIEVGAWDYLKKPITIATLRLVLQRALIYRNESSPAISFDRFQQEGILGSSPCILNCLEILSKAAASKRNVLLLGETGTGKELFARAIHNCGPRSDKPFVTVDCSSLPENLAESVLFGHLKGSFTGAHTSRTGLIKEADGGTLFLDEIAELPLTEQKIFLRVLQERLFRPLGSNKEEGSDFRLIAATNKDLSQLVVQGGFRQDLYHRLCVHQLILPKLANRKEDFKPLVQHFISRACQEYGIDEKGFAQEYLEVLFHYDWPGNVRELINAVYASIDSALSSPKLYPQHLPVNIRAKAMKQSMRQQQTHDNGYIHRNEKNESLLQVVLNTDGSLPSLKKIRGLAMNKTEHLYLNQLISESGGNVKEACRLANISRARYYELLKKHDIAPSSGY